MGKTSSDIERIAGEIIKREVAIRHRTYKSMTDGMLKHLSIHELSYEDIEEMVEIFRRECRRDLVNLVSIFRFSEGGN